jgi:hypothetical protein
MIVIGAISGTRIAVIGINTDTMTMSGVDMVSVSVITSVTVHVIMVAIVVADITTTARSVTARAVAARSANKAIAARVATPAVRNGSEGESSALTRAAIRPVAGARVAKKKK